MPHAIPIVQAESAVHRRQGAVEQDAVASFVVVEVLDMTKVGHCGGHGSAEARGAVTRNLQSGGEGDFRCTQPRRIPSAAGDVYLQAVDCPAATIVAK